MVAEPEVLAPEVDPVVVVLAVPVVISVVPVVVSVVVPVVPRVSVGDPEGAPWHWPLPESASVPPGAVRNCQS